MFKPAHWFYGTPWIAAQMHEVPRVRKTCQNVVNHSSKIAREDRIILQDERVFESTLDHSLQGFQMTCVAANFPRLECGTQSLGVKEVGPQILRHGKAFNGANPFRRDTGCPQLELDGSTTIFVTVPVDVEGGNGKLAFPRGPDLRFEKWNRAAT
nr:hypothetical protein [Hyphomicrobium sp.]